MSHLPITILTGISALSKKILKDFLGCCVAASPCFPEFTIDDHGFVVANLAQDPQSEVVVGDKGEDALQGVVPALKEIVVVTVPHRRALSERRGPGGPRVDDGG